MRTSLTAIFHVWRQCRNTVEENSNPNAFFAISNGMWAVKLCSNKILQLGLPGCPVYGRKMVVVPGDPMLAGCPYIFFLQLF